MLNLNEVAQWLTNTFNEIGSAHEPKYTFNIYAEVGEDKNNADIQGVYKVDIPKNVPVDKIVNVRYYGDIDLTVSAPRSNYNLANVEEIVGEVAKQINGTEKVFANGKGYITMSVTGTGNFKTEYSQGNIVPLKIKLDINYSENVVTGGGKHWYIAEIGGEYNEIPFITERVTVEKDGKVSPINDKTYKQAFMLAQQRSYMFTLPYDTTVGALITRDILKGDANKHYKLKYVDGVAFTEDENGDNSFETEVVLYRNGDNGETKPDTAMLNIIFTDADDGSNTTKYSLALIDNEFDGATENTRWFDTQAEQETWFETRIANGANYDSIDAPNLNNLVLTNQVYKNTRGYDIFDLVNKNYAVIRVIKGENNPQYYYYKVTNADIGANGQVIYTLQLDSIQTWLFRDNLIIDDSFINKAHLDRWVDNGNGTISFNGKADSKLFEREEIRNVATRLKYRTPLKLETEKNSAITNWINENVICWCYVLVNSQKLNFIDIKTEQVVENTLISTKSKYGNNAGFYLDYGYSILCYPIMVSPTTEFLINVGDISGELNKNVKISPDGLDGFTNNNTGFSYIYGIKLSQKPPIHLNESQFEYEINKVPGGQNQLIIKNGLNKTNGLFTIYDSDGLIAGNETLDAGFVTGTFTEDEYNGLFYVTCDEIKSYTLTTSLALPATTFNKTDIVNKAKNKKFNPKLNSIDYKSLRLTFGGSVFDYDLQKINAKLVEDISIQAPIKFDYIEMISADTTKALLRLKIDDFVFDEIFTSAYGQSFNGFIISNDLSLPIVNNQFGLFLANNKNAYLSFQSQQNYIRSNIDINREQNFVQGALNMANGIGQMGQGIAKGGKGLGDVVSGLTGTLTSGYQTFANDLYMQKRGDLQLSYNKTQFDLSLDNMKNAPETLSNANGNSNFIFSVSNCKFWAELYEGLDTELESANDIMFRDGYNLNRFEESGKTIKDYCHTRKYFNYIKAVLGNIHGVPMSDTMRADLRNRFASGIRFWHQDTIDYSMENYERNLATE